MVQTKKISQTTKVGLSKDIKLQFATLSAIAENMETSNKRWKTKVGVCYSSAKRHPAE